MRTTWKRDSFIRLGVIVLVLGIGYYCVQTPIQPVVVKPIETSYIPPPISTPKSPKSTDWTMCLVGSALPDKPTTDIAGFARPATYTVIIQNKCPVTLDMVNIRVKFYDANDSRVGWETNTVDPLESNEKVKWQSEYPVKSYPLLVNGAARIQIFDYQKGTN